MGGFIPFKGRPDLPVGYSFRAKDSMPIKEEAPIFTPRSRELVYKGKNPDTLQKNPKPIAKPYFFPKVPSALF
jgi:hypothetical protein